MFSVFAWYFLSLQGRVSRQEFRLGCLALLTVNALLFRIFYRFTVPSAIFYHGDNAPDVNHLLRWPVLVAIAIVIWPLIAVFVKRLHDLNVSGWWMLVTLAIPLLSRAINVNAWTIFLSIALFLSFMPGAVGDNRFGRNPLARTEL
jgi:uncharacterized membrane protein YhaH (DUF805 family)